MNSNEWLGIIKTWCSEDEVLRKLTLSQQAKLATRLSFFFIDNFGKIGDIEDDLRLYLLNSK